MAQNLAALVGSRICHDIISPIGAIANGIELLEMSGVTAGPELDLINQSSRAAADTVRVLRMAFGPASTTETVPSAELADLLGLLQKGGRTQVDMRITGDILRALAKLVLLAVMCAETSLLPGVTITVQAVRDGVDLHVAGSGLRDGAQARLAHLTDPSTAPELGPSYVQFPLAAETAADLGLTPAVHLGDTSLTMRFR